MTATMEQNINYQRIEQAIKYLEEKYGEKLQNEHVNNLHARLKIELNFFSQELEEISNSNGTALSNFQTIYLDLLDEQRRLLDKINHKSEFDEEIVRKFLSLIDIEEFKTREKQLHEV